MEMTNPMLATIVDFHALWKILLAAFVVGVGVTFLFGQGAIAAERISQARAGNRSSGAGAFLRDGTLVTVATAACIAAIVLGVVAMTKK
jgi:hypothetical protein